MLALRLPALLQQQPLLPRSATSVTSAVRHASSRPASSSSSSSSSSAVLKGFLLAFPVITFGLGTWQVFRKQQKEELIAQLEAKLTKDPVPLPASVVDVSGMEYNRVVVKGTFLHDKELIVEPRTLLREMFSNNGEVVSGAHVITPFKRADNGQIILVNRGFVPRELQSAATRADGQVAGEVTLTGIVRLGEKQTAFVPDNNPEKNHWRWIDIFAMAQHVGAAPILIDVVEECTPKSGYPLGGQSRVQIRNEHLQYILTWYALSAATLALYLYSRKRTPKSNRPLPPRIYK